MMGFNFGMVGFGMLLMVLFWVCIVGGAVWLVVTLARANQSYSASRPLVATGPMSQTPLDVLNARYAKGEITKEQFDEMKRDLGA